MIYDCAIIGGGPAGLNAALVLGRARKSVVLLDNGQARNRVTHASHGFITRDGVKPAEFRRIAYEEVLKYPTVRHWNAEAKEISRSELGFIVRTASGEQLESRKLLLAAGLKEVFPEIKGLQEFYGRSLFNCPFCDGWELRDKPLAVVSSRPQVYHTAKLLTNWTQDIVVCTNGSGVLTGQQIKRLENSSIRVIDTPVIAFAGQEGMLESVHFADGSQIARAGGFIAPEFVTNARFAESLGYELQDGGGIAIDMMGRTTAPGVYAAGDSAYVMPSQLIYAAASGSKAAMGMIADWTEEAWETP
ncbi:NAD(P)/FAD-dependent oxidoreductase [Paenibacillus sp. CN-4]|uniref:NAD(P)/FAD-dependent oxidoreductase n=1 Tax=Paenibacillus nanchangensis TaxID=3348343 RepID=UPI0039786214